MLRRRTADDELAMTIARAQNIIRKNLLTKFHEDRKINVASRVLTRKNAPPPGSHDFQPTGIIFELAQDIIGMNLLTMFHEDRTVNVASRTNLLTKLHEDWTINVASRVLTKKNAPPLFHDVRKINVTSRPRPCDDHVFQPTGIIFELVQDIIGMNLLTEFHEDRTINVASRVKNAPLLGGHVIQANTINVASRVFTRKNAPPPGGHVFQPTGIIFELWPLEKNAPPLGSHVFQAKVTIFELIKDISGTNLLSKIHEDRKINVASRVKNAPPPDIIWMNLLTKFHEDQTITVASRVKNAPPLGSHVFQANVTIFKLILDIIETNPLTKLHEDWTINANVDVPQRTTHDAPRCAQFAHLRGTNILVNSHVIQLTGTIFFNSTLKNAPHTGCHVFSPIPTIFKLVRDINKTNFHDDWANIVTSRVFTRFLYSKIGKTANIYIYRKCPAHWRPCFSPISTIFELVRDIN
ncbi:hypothetical protein DPMN_161543 [Dreissena polymorpha]|uniref:Uncharacterized protein n=1 Tax=Dreissena polymorpha TaxID=45954 RepID=A0A9D4EPU1_DREPO|nr:hypothetical protein DPMN_161543 [Dreissena polymorpha]